jgi:hypothetical protein
MSATLPHVYVFGAVKTLIRGSGDFLVIVITNPYQGRI